MKKVTDLKENECISFKNKNEFKKVLKLRNGTKINHNWWKDDIVYYPFLDQWGVLINAREKYNIIHPASDFLEPTYQLTKSQIIEIAENASLVKELFPERFEVEFEIGRWYKAPKLGKAIFNITEIKNKIINAYGLNYQGIWKNEEDFYGKLSEYIVPATPEEVTEALINEAKSRGFKNGNYKCLRSLTLQNTIDDYFYEEERNLLWRGLKGKANCVFDNGKWAEICKEPKKITISEIENILGYSIEIVK